MQKLVAVMFLSIVAIPTFVAAEEIRWYTNLDVAIQAAVQQRKPLMLHCWFETCGPCKTLETYVFPNADLAQAINQSVIPVKVDITIQREIASRYGVKRVPQDVFITPSGFVLLKRPSPAEPKEYIKLVQAVYQLYKTQDALATSSLNQADSQKELTEFGGQIQQQALQDGSNQTKNLVSHAATVVDQATGKINDQVVGSMHQAASYLNADSADKYNTDDRFLPQAQQPYTAQADFASAQESRIVPASHASLPTSPQGAASSPAGSAFNGVVANPFIRQPAQTTQSESGTNRPMADAAAREPIAVSQPIAPKQTASHVAALGQIAPVIAATANINIPKSEIRHAEPGPALDGYCPVSLKHSRQWVKGDVRWGCYHRGKLFMFSSKENRDLFLTQPDHFSPALVGYDPVIYAESGELVEGSRKVGVFYPAENPNIYVFANEQSKTTFQTNPEMFAQKVRVATTACDQNGTLR